jgi:hypothetical protein
MFTFTFTFRLISVALTLTSKLVSSISIFLPVNLIYTIKSLRTRSSGEELMTPTSLECFSPYTEASTPYKLIIIQFRDPLLCTIYTRRDYDYSKFI